MRGSEEVDVVPFDAEPDAEFAVAFPVRTWEWSEEWAAKALLARLFAGLPITPTGTTVIPSLAGLTLA
jgi:hypothetical protein